jgi:hypothetical protein
LIGSNSFILSYRPSFPVIWKMGAMNKTNYV